MDDIARIMDEIQESPGDALLTHDKYVKARDQLRASLAPLCATQQSESTPFQAARSRVLGLSDAKEAHIPLSDERLTEIEADHAARCPIMQYEDGVASQRQVARACRDDDLYVDHCDIVTLLAEVRRLQRENHLLSLSRGTPIVGQD